MIALKAERWLESRGISLETAIEFGIYTARRGHTGGDMIPSDDGDVLVFPYLDHKREVGAKYRAAGKRFWSKANCKKTFYHGDIIDHEMLQDGRASLLITEGEMDCIAAWQSGYPWVVSVPNGAGGTTDEAFDYVFDAWDRLKKIKNIIIGVDNDEAGKKLASELVRRLNRIRCSFLVYPEGCKDLNDVLIREGSAAVIATINSAKPYPVSGVYGYDDLPDEQEIRPVSTGWPVLDEFVKPYYPALMVVSGPANHGKSAWTTQLVAHLAKHEGWNVAIASFEMRLKPYVTNVISSIYVDRPKDAMTEAEDSSAKDFMRRKFCFIAPEPDSDEDHDIDWLLERCAAAVIRHGARVILIDPWNEVEHVRRQGEALTEYTNRAIKKIKEFTRQFDVLFILVAHPTKGAVNNKSVEELNLYDVSDSAAFANKADIGIIVGRVGDNKEGRTMIFVRKVRYQPETGTLGEAELAFDRSTRMFF